MASETLQVFKCRLEVIFQAAIAGGTRSSGVKSRVELDDALLECFTALSSKCKDEEAEDLVYFILDIYQFHGVPVALAELDIDQVSCACSSACTGT